MPFINTSNAKKRQKKFNAATVAIKIKRSTVKDINEKYTIRSDDKIRKTCEIRLKKPIKKAPSSIEMQFFIFKLELHFCTIRRELNDIFQRHQESCAYFSRAQPRTFINLLSFYAYIN